MAEETDTKRYLDYDGLKYLIEKLTNRIEASGGGGSPWVPEPGAYVAYTDADGVNRIAKPSEYKSDGNTPCGVLVVHGGGSLLMGLNPDYVDEEGNWSKNSQTHGTGGTQVSDLSKALLDMDGERNTLAALLMDGMSDADGYYDENNENGFFDLSWRYNVRRANVRSGRWIPSMGELKVIHDNLDEVRECLSVCGGEDFFDEENASPFTLISSTNASDTQIWAWNFETNRAQTMSKTAVWGRIRNVSRFAWVPDGYSGGASPTT